MKKKAITIILISIDIFLVLAGILALKYFNQDEVSTLDNLDICNRMIGDDKYSCLTNFAGMEKDVSICETMQGREWKEKCYLRVAASKSDRTICEKIPDIETKNQCFAIAAGNKKDCEIISDPKWNKSCRMLFFHSNLPNTQKCTFTEDCDVLFKKCPTGKGLANCTAPRTIEGIDLGGICDVECD